MDSMNSNFPPPPSVSSTITETQSEIKENTGSSGLANSNVDVKSTVSEDTSVSHINSSNIPATTAATSAAFINVATAAPSPPISINYPPGIQNGIGGSNAISNTEPNVSISHKHVLPPPSASAISNAGKSVYQLPSISNLNNLSNYNFGVSSSPGQTQLPSFNVISQNLNEQQAPSTENIKLPSATQLLNQTAINNVSQSPDKQNVSGSILGSTKQINEESATIDDTTQNEQSGNLNYKPLNVKDALYYLDQVKLQFREQTDVYNNFLDIMKDFKSQNIDTPGVIERVSSLFKGHPKLIDGFNTFLPQGFSIQCSTSDPYAIVVTTPVGTTIRRDSQGSQKLSATVTPVKDTEQNPEQSNQPVQSLPSQNTQSVQHTHGYTLQEEESKQSSPAEFDQAINYVNKIKQRYSSQPDIYKLFLENLQMYQKGLKPIHEVYREISVLFRDAPDLLEDFKLFMPDNTSIKDVQQDYNNYPQYYQQSVQLPPVGNFQSGAYPNGQTAHNNVLINQQYQTHSADQEVVLDPYQYQQQQMYQQLYQQNDSGVAKSRKQSISGVSQLQTMNNKGSIQPRDEFPVSNLRGSVYEQPIEKPALISGVLEPVYPKTLETDLSNEINFFDKVKKSIGNKQTYNEFLKLLKLYSSDVIDKGTLQEKVRTLIGGFPELFQWFKNFIGWEETPLRIEDIAIKKQQIDLVMCKAAGPSYRQLPKSQTKMPCSGRDDLCWSIFNDQWVGHPVWASEESGFIAHRKNQYEEMLFRIEDERHEYDYFMEANLRTIQTLETIANRMANMTPEEKAKFKLPVGLGHTSSTIYVKVIRKVYDKDRGWEVIDALHEHPAITVPIVLKRLKQKDEEWKRAHREWNKVWREAEQKLLIKSLDHLGLSFKNIDKKLLTNKQLVSEIATVKTEQANKKLHPLMTKAKDELVTQYEDFSIFMDVLKLVNANLKQNQTYSQNDKERMESFLRSFMIKFFFMSPVYIDEQLQKRSIIHNNKEISDDQSFISKKDHEVKIPTPTLSQTKKRPRDYDLLKDVLRKNKKKKSEQQQVEEKEDDALDEDISSEEMQKAQESWISSELIDANESFQRTEYNMFANTQIYVFYRHLDTLYKRLLEIKKMAPEVNKEIKSRVATPFAVDLGLIDNHLEELGVAIKGDDSYSEALDLCSKFIENKVEQNVFEDALRNGFRNRAFKLFTIDRVIQSFMKHCHTLVSDTKCSEILLLMENDRNHARTSTRDQILYRVQVRGFMNMEENMFKIVFDKATKTTTITFLAQEDLTIKSAASSKEDAWKYYLTSFSMSNPTEGIDTSKVNMPFLKAQIDAEEENESTLDGVVDSRLSIQIDPNTYRMKFEPNSYDLFIRKSLYEKPESEKVTRSTNSRLSKFKRIIDGEHGVASDLKGETLEMANEKLKLLKEKGPEEYLKFKAEKEAEETRAKSEKENREKTATEQQKNNEVKRSENNVATSAGYAEDMEKKPETEINELKKDSNEEQQKADQNNAETTVVEGDSTIQQDETIEKVDV
ncbi:hypothetical protein CANINC_004925 [Pichia inconspicua]|uniref:Histone deacetylase interacting domain-containing protein n=1 Tax=Pichia inconspicua TaxID=52247 RepID=A0A4T0WUV5_9ASCO|nr:hypothetical protein CANINC_004925 [[Candida] inconspicua]